MGSIMIDPVSGAKSVASTFKGAQSAGKELGQVVSGQQADMEKTVQEAHRKRMQAKAQEEKIRNAEDYNAFAKFEEEKQKEQELTRLKNQATAKYGKDAWNQIEALKIKIKKEREEELKLYQNSLDEVGGPSYLANLSQSVPTSANIAYYAKIVKEKMILRNLISTATQVVSECYDTAQDADAILDKAERAIL